MVVYLLSETGQLQSVFAVVKYIESAAIKFSCHVKDSSEIWSGYVSGTRFLDKNLELKFSVEAVTASRLKFPLVVTFRKKNHGPDVPFDEREEDVRTQVIKKAKDSPYSTCTLDEGTSYRGLHTMGCEVRDDDGVLIYRNKIAVLIK